MVKVERKVWNSMRILEYYESTFDGSEHGIEEQYEFLSNLIGVYGGRIHGSQFQGDGHSGSVAVYFEIPTENKEDFLKEEKSN